MFSSSVLTELSYIICVKRRVSIGDCHLTRILANISQEEFEEELVHKACRFITALRGDRLYDASPGLHGPESYFESEAKGLLYMMLRNCPFSRN